MTKVNERKRGRVRKLLNYGLYWVQETAPDIDEETGEEIPGTERPCLVQIPLPPGLSEAQKRNRNAIAAATKRAVYELGMKEYGNKLLTIAAVGDPFEVPFEEVTETRLVPVRRDNPVGTVGLEDTHNSDEGTDEATDEDADEDTDIEESLVNKNTSHLVECEVDD